MKYDIQIKNVFQQVDKYRNEEVGSGLATAFVQCKTIYIFFFLGMRLNKVNLLNTVCVYICVCVGVDIDVYILNVSVYVSC